MTEKSGDRALVLLSGGLDSTTCLALAVDKYGSSGVTALSVYYGQKHEKEVEASEKVAGHYGVEHLSLDLTPIFQYSDSALLQGSDRKIPEISYSEQLKATKGSPVSTYVPFRNGLFLSSAASIALSRHCGVIYYGIHADDAAGNAYPDCSEGFNKAMNEAIYIGSGNSCKFCYSIKFILYDVFNFIKRHTEEFFSKINFIYTAVTESFVKCCFKFWSVFREYHCMHIK